MSTEIGDRRAVKLTHYAQNIIPNRSVRYVINELEHPKGPPVLYLMFCGEGNTAWENQDVLDMQAAIDPEQIDRPVDDRKQFHENRLRARIAATGVDRIANVYDETGAEVTGPEATLELLMNIPRYALNRIYNFVTYHGNFPREHTEPAAAAGAVAKK